MGEVAEIDHAGGGQKGIRSSRVHAPPSMLSIVVSPHACRMPCCWEQLCRGFCSWR